MMCCKSEDIGGSEEYVTDEPRSAECVYTDHIATVSPLLSHVQSPS